MAFLIGLPVAGPHSFAFPLLGPFRRGLVWDVGSFLDSPLDLAPTFRRGLGIVFDLLLLEVARPFRLSEAFNIPFFARVLVGAISLSDTGSVVAFRRELAEPLGSSAC